MKICIYGAGAIGGYMAVMLKRGGADVSLVARGAHLDAIRQNGLKLLMDGEEIVERMPATSNPAELGVQDYVIVTLKAHQAWQVVEDMVPLLGEQTAVVTAQNGLPWWYFHGLGQSSANLRLHSVDPDNRQWNTIGPERVIGATVYPATEIVEPGVVKHIYGNQFGLGEPDRSSSARVDRLAAAMDAGGLKTRFYEDIRDDIWIKLWGNLCFNPISALTGATLDVVATDPGTRSLARSMMLEAQTIGKKFGANFRVDVERRIDGAAGVGAHRTSMLQDVDKGRAIELDALLTSVQEMGRLSKVETPFIDSVLALAQQMGRVKGLYPTFPEVAVIKPAMAS
ncbi:2-dehydropantoate 2-reductase [Phyllobacterium myrsinacearum]|uniref:2-dehydropantoate 2-reductase n=1 Tax=Phyllobacterium myrsinacearum TaxID=28101 RepID=A0A839EJT2_9HYPH|nr:2-dehydropantoate 2-reductase [Phyllobacterium myrsinacearum]MBA8879059.1 2-dehydropantoate 2-reductase [Phyllobacterium myrsinacearum]